MRATRRGPGLRALSAGVVACATALVAWPASSAPNSLTGGESEALDVRADRLEVDLAAARATLEGHVQLKRGDVEVGCPRVEAKFDAGGHMMWAHATGPVTADVRGAHVEAEDAEVDMARQTLTMKGHVKVTRGAARLTAERGTVQFATAKLILEEVHGVLPGPLGTSGVGVGGPAPASSRP